MKYEKKLKELREQKSNDWFKPLKLKYPTTSPRGQPIERRHFITLKSKVKPTGGGDF